MSAWMVDKKHIDLLVKAAQYYKADGWWQVDESGEFVGWRYLKPYEDDEEQNYTPSQLGQILVNENRASVSHRYSEPGRVVYYGADHASQMDDLEDEELPGPIDRYYLAPYVYTDPGRVLSPGEVFRAIDCLDYQSCEHDGWRKSEAFAFLTVLRETVCTHVADYKQAPWGFDS